MFALQTLGTAAFCLSCLAVGVRLALLARRTRRLPEAVFALALLSAGGLGYGSAALSVSGVTELPLLGIPTIQLALIGVGLGASGVGVFTWRVFRPSSRSALALLGIGVGLIATSIAALILTGHGDARDLLTPWFWVGFAPRSLAYAWSGAESMRYFVLMRRRQRLGLADGADAQRFLLWGVAALAAFSMHVPVALDALSGSSRPGMEPSSALVAAALGLTSAGALWRAFFGPIPFSRFGRRRPPQTPS